LLLVAVGCGSSPVNKALQSVSPQDFSKVEAKVTEVLNEEGVASVVIHLAEKADLLGTNTRDWKAKGQIVVDALRNVASRSQAPVLGFLRDNERLNKASAIESLWICNCIVVTADAETIATLAGREDVKSISANQPMPTDLEPATPAPTGPETAVEWNINIIGADSVWSDFGITGNGVTVGNMDTGARWDHPALKEKYRGWDAKSGTVSHDYNWYDATHVHSLVPIDNAGHGTHTTGTIVGDDGGANQIGVAPGAKWIMTAIIDDGATWVVAAHRGFQWMIAPTDLNGENPQPDLRPAVVNNSWGCFSLVAGCTNVEEFRDDVDAWIAAGIFPEFSAGNEGPGPRTMRWPGGYAESFSTGATNRSDTIAGFSSRGPGQDDTTKPEVVAPGDQVRSSLPNGSYGLMSGTSMAGPHVVGTVALLLEVNPGLTYDDLATLIEETAIPMGDGLPNNTFGWGRIFAYWAVYTAMFPQ
jgi:subtilisin family serine protease